MAMAAPSKSLIEPTVRVPCTESLIGPSESLLVYSESLLGPFET